MSKHFTNGSAFPELTSTLRLYSMRFCPYAQRARIVLIAKDIPHEVVNINLQDKPDWYLKINPLGTVPCLHIDNDKAIPESLIVCDYLDAKYGEHKLTPSDPYTQAQHKLIVEAFNKVISNFYKVLKQPEAGSAEALTLELSAFENRLQSDFFGGNNVALVDYMVWPHLERIFFMGKTNRFDFPQDKFPKLHAYAERILELPAVKQTYTPVEVLDKWITDYLAGKKCDYDPEE